MLSRTAESLYWAARYMERADTVASLLDVGYRMSMMPAEQGGLNNEWESVLISAGVLKLFNEKYSEISQQNVTDFLFFERDNPSSVISCITAARNNARSVRTALTSQVWYAMNYAYLKICQYEREKEHHQRLSPLCEWARRQTAALRGAHLNSQLIDQGSDFFNLGLYIERADNTARLLDVKYYVLLPTVGMVGGEFDNRQWVTLLRTLSSYSSFHWAYGEGYSAYRIAHFLILNEACPRSLTHCLTQVNHHLLRLGKRLETETQASIKAAKMLDKIKSANINTVISNGLHEYLNDFIRSNSQLADEIGESFLFRKL